MADNMAANVEVSPRSARPMMAAAAALGVMVAATGALWAYFGTTVFFEMVRNGWAACF